MAVISNRNTTPDPIIGTWLGGVCCLGLVFISFAAPFFFPWKLHFSLDNLPQRVIIQFGVVFVLVLWLARKALDSRPFILKSLFYPPVFAIVLWTFFSSLSASNRYEGLFDWLHWTACAIMFFLTVNCMRTERDAVLLIAAIYLSGFLIAILGIVQHLTGLAWVPQTAPPAATFSNKNMAVHFIVLTFPLGLGFLWYTRKASLIWLLCLTSALMVSYLIYTQTRAGWLALAVELFFLTGLFFREHRLKRGLNFLDQRKILGMVSAVVLIFLMTSLSAAKSGSFAERASSIVAGHNEPFSSSSLRLDIWANTMAMIKDNLVLGVGLGNHKIFYPLYHQEIVQEKVFSEHRQLRDVHNDYLQAFAEQGVIGIVLLCWFGFTIFRSVFLLTLPGNPVQTRFLVIGIATGIVGLLVNACFSSAFQRSIPPFVLMAYVGLLGVFSARDDEQIAWVMPRTVVLIVVCLSTVCLVWLGRFQYMSMQSDNQFHALLELEAERDWHGLIEVGGKAYDYNPYNKLSLAYVGRAQVELGKFKQGADTLERLLASFPNNMNALMFAGVAYSRLGDFDRAEGMFARAIRIKPDYGKAHNNLGSIYLQQRRFEKALQKFEIAVKLQPDDKLVYYNLGVTLRELGRFEESAEAYARALEIDPEFAKARKEIESVLSKYLKQSGDGLRWRTGKIRLKSP